VTTATLHNVGWYVGIAIGAAVLATGVQLGVVLSGTAPIEWRPLAATFTTTLFAALSTAAGTAFRPKAGREDVSELVSLVGPRKAVEALEVEVVKQETGIDGVPLTSQQRRLILADLKAELTRDPEGADPLGEPAFLRRAQEGR